MRLRGTPRNALVGLPRARSSTQQKTPRCSQQLTSTATVCRENSPSIVGSGKDADLAFQLCTCLRLLEFATLKLIWRREG